MVNDQNFPLIDNSASTKPFDWGTQHGESFRAGIQELAEIRRNLMLGKNPTLVGEKLDQLAQIQWEATKNYDLQIWEELEGIRQAAQLSVTQIVILNNYTDFRDIAVDEGCSTVFVSQSDQVLAGQTWDMHSSARNYVCVVKSPEHSGQRAFASFSLVGCVGMMGFNSAGAMIGVNNLNTRDAVPGVLWPALVRKALKESTRSGMEQLLLKTPVTSAHNYLIADRSGGQMWEITPTLKVKVSEQPSDSQGVLYHTNHCLDAETKAIENFESVSKTSVQRQSLLEKKAGNVNCFQSLYDLLTDHEGHPISICSHYESGAQDPSFTCGGGVGDLRTGKLKFWRGCETYDKNFRSIEIDLKMR